MKQYIDKDALVAEIDRQIKLFGSENYKGSDRLTIEERLFTLDSIKEFIETLEVKEVDLDKEFNNFLDDVEGVPRMWHSDEQIEWGKDIARQFYELGVRAKQTLDEVKIGETKIYLDDDGGEPPYDGKQWLDLSCTEYEIPSHKFKDGDNVEIIIRKTQKGE